MKFVIVGGGTAGWLTALYIKKHFSHHNVTVVASSEIGILGAGEGTTPAFMDFLDTVGITEYDLIQNCKATYKTGIKFTNWNGDGDYYFHNFSDDLYALHFDAALLAKYLQSVALERGVILLDKEVVKPTFNENKDITSLVFSDGTGVDGDFFFDCSGFKRLFLQDRKWNSYAESMPCKRAIPFFIPHDDNIVPITESIALKNGWMWKIPVQGRYGCGYVFDSDYTTDEEAKQEVRDYLGHDIEFPRVFDFKAGNYDKVWENNVLAVGLSAGFIEPLEATSIWVQVLTLKIFVQVFGTNYGQDKLNSDIKEINEDILSFLYLHYMTERDDSEFWQNFEMSNKYPNKLKTLLKSENLTQALPQYKFNLFTEQSWAAIATGTRLTK